MDEVSKLNMRAAEYLAAGKPAVAEYLSRAVLERDPRNATAWNTLGKVAMGVGMPAFALEWFRRALEADPYFKAASKNLKDAEKAAAAMPAPAGTRYLLVREWAAGFWSDVDHVLGMCLLAEFTARMPVVWWGEQSRFRSGEGNAWDQFFAPVSPVPIQHLRGLRAFPGRWDPDNLERRINGRWHGVDSRLVGLHLLNRQEEVVVSDFHTSVKAVLGWAPPGHAVRGMSLGGAYRYLVHKYLRVRPEIIAEVDRFAAVRFAGGPVIGVHVRGTDKVGEDPKVVELSGRYHELIAGMDPATRLFLLTDDQRVREEYVGRYRDRVVTTECVRGDSGRGVHFQGHADGRRLGQEVLIDTLLACRCDRFIGLGMSNVSCFVGHLRDWKPGEFTLLGDHVQELWNVFALTGTPPKDIE